MNLPVTMPDISKIYREERDIMHEQELRQKAAYRKELEKQMVDNNMKKQREEEMRKSYEIAMLKNYPPFGRRTDLSNYATYDKKYDTMSNGSNNNVAIMKDFESNSFNNKPQRYSSLENTNNFRDGNESRASRESKDMKPVFGTTTGMEPYFPYGKPGNGAPMVDENGNKRTRIAGNLWFNLNGQTPNDRQDRLLSYNVKNTASNILQKEVKSNESKVKPGADEDSWILERKKAFLEQLDNINSSEKYQPDYRLKKSELNADYKGLRGNANWFHNTFGRPGNGAPTYDARRHNIYDVLESPRNYFQDSTTKNSNYNEINMPNMVYPKVNPQISSSHRNSYDYVPKDKSHILN